MKYTTKTAYCSTCIYYDSNRKIYCLCWQETPLSMQLKMARIHLKIFHSSKSYKTSWHKCNIIKFVDK